MENETRMVGHFEVKHAIHIGHSEILFCMDETNRERPYLVCNCTTSNPIGMEQYFSRTEGTDYLQMMSEFTSRVNDQLEFTKAEQDKIAVPLQPFTLEQCNPDDHGQSIENQVVVIRLNRLRPEYQTADKQLVLATGGFGTAAHSRGRAVYTTNLYSGKESRWNREDILGTLKPEHMPNWAKERLTQLQAERQPKHKKQEQER
ncbi:MAG: hypothetical protein K6T85_07375 [Gorillibacterium sp.]|nr:hypothetical protein [Gorillibacterium sp.]